MLSGLVPDIYYTPEGGQQCRNTNRNTNRTIFMGEKYDRAFIVYARYRVWLCFLTIAQGYEKISHPSRARCKFFQPCAADKKSRLSERSGIGG